MIIDILTIFPEMFTNVLQESILKRAQQKKLITINVHNLRDWTTDKHKMTDDRPFGGGPGMVMKIGPVFNAVKELSSKNETTTILLSPQGQTFKQSLAQKLSKLKHIILICGRYEGIDERVREKLIDQEISIGDYVLTGGEIPAMAITDAITRLIPGVLGNKESSIQESFQNNLLDHPQYTHPRNFQNMKVPEILLSGNHKEIAKWRHQKSMEKTKKQRPDLIK